MARLGVDYEQVKQTAIKLLSQGFAPSVQKIREVLGTGSNTTIAEHLKVWREEYAKMTVHHLPSNMPKQLISAFEVLWQVAMEQAQNQLAEYKQTIESEREAALQKERDADKYVTDIKQKMAELSISLEHEASTKQKCNIELAITNDRLIKQEESFVAQRNQYGERLKRVYEEKDKLEEKNQQLHHEVKVLHKNISFLAQQHQHSLEQQNTLHQQSENRWLKLIDQAKQEVKDAKKMYEALKNSSDLKSKNLNAMIADFQINNIEKESQLNKFQDQISKLQQEIKFIESEYINAKAIITTYDVKKNNDRISVRNKSNNIKHKKDICS